MAITKDSIPSRTDQGTTATGGWVRYNNGYAICWGSTSVQTCATAMGTLFGPAAVEAVVFPIAFTGIPVVTTSPVTVTGNIVGAKIDTLIATGCNMSAVATPTGGTGSVNWTAVGTWF